MDVKLSARGGSGNELEPCRTQNNHCALSSGLRQRAQREKSRNNSPLEDQFLVGRKMDFQYALYYVNYDMKIESRDLFFKKIFL